ncbi:MAG: 2-dehydropantoate 2-reductase [Deltaproteobacteria bacterium]|nr:2-dehydropantoate 2-reductase [Deltaproteobacteria bacterium]
MHFLIIGPGAMGTLFSVRLTRAGHRVTLLDYKADRAEFIRKNGLRMEGLTQEAGVHIPAVTTAISDPIDVVLVCVKSTQTQTVAREIADWLPPEADILTLQNGLGNIETLGSLLGKDRVFGGVTSEGATLIGTGHARHAGKGETFIGPATPNPKNEVSIQKMVAAFQDAGFHTQATDEVEGLIWGKLIVNVGINALCAITGLKNGRLIEIASTKTLMEMAVAEAVEIVKAKDIRLPYEDPLKRVIHVCRATADNVASMLQDVLAKKPTEVRFINGAIVREGEKLKIPAPVNSTLTRLVETLQETYDERLMK